MRIWEHFNAFASIRDRTELREKLFNTYILSDSTVQFQIHAKFVDERVSFYRKAEFISK